MFWLGLGAAFGLLVGVFAFMQTGKEVMNGPLASALLVYVIPASIAIIAGRIVRRWPVLTVFASLISYAVAFVFTFSYGVNVHWLGK